MARANGVRDFFDAFQAGFQMVGQVGSQYEINKLDPDSMKDGMSALQNEYDRANKKADIYQKYGMSDRANQTRNQASVQMSSALKLSQAQRQEEQRKKMQELQKDVQLAMKGDDEEAFNRVAMMAKDMYNGSDVEDDANSMDFIDGRAVISMPDGTQVAAFDQLKGNPQMLQKALMQAAMYGQASITGDYSQIQSQQNADRKFGLEQSKADSQNAYHKSMARKNDADAKRKGGMTEVQYKASILNDLTSKPAKLMYALGITDEAMVTDIYNARMAESKATTLPAANDAAGGAKETPPPKIAVPPPTRSGRGQPIDRTPKPAAPPKVTAPPKPRLPGPQGRPPMAPSQAPTGALAGRGQPRPMERQEINNPDPTMGNYGLGAATSDPQAPPPQLPQSLNDMMLNLPGANQRGNVGPYGRPY